MKIARPYVKSTCLARYQKCAMFVRADAEPLQPAVEEPSSGAEAPAMGHGASESTSREKKPTQSENVVTERTKEPARAVEEPAAPRHVPPPPRPPSMPHILSPAGDVELDARGMTVSGVAEPDSKLYLFDRNRPVGSTFVDAAGRWSIEIDVTFPGEHVFTARVEDEQGASSRLSPPNAVTVFPPVPAEQVKPATEAPEAPPTVETLPEAEPFQITGERIRRRKARRKPPTESAVDARPVNISEFSRADAGLRGAELETTGPETPAPDSWTAGEQRDAGHPPAWTTPVAPIAPKGEASTLHAVAPERPSEVDRTEEPVQLSTHGAPVSRITRGSKEDEPSGAAPERHTEANVAEEPNHPAPRITPRVEWAPERPTHDDQRQEAEDAAEVAPVGWIDPERDANEPHPLAPEPPVIPMEPVIHDDPPRPRFVDVLPGDTHEIDATPSVRARATAEAAQPMRPLREVLTPLPRGLAADTHNVLESTSKKSGGNPTVRSNLVATPPRRGPFGRANAASEPTPSSQQASRAVATTADAATRRGVSIHRVPRLEGTRRQVLAVGVGIVSLCLVAVVMLQLLSSHTSSPTRVGTPRSAPVAAAAWSFPAMRTRPEQVMLSFINPSRQAATVRIQELQHRGAVVQHIRIPARSDALMALPSRLGTNALSVDATAPVQVERLGIDKTRVTRSTGTPHRARGQKR
ncbi:MAG: hypothetical protein NVSMB22_04160 [Chloroflexota bacterium]